ncbi:MAG: PhnD/SsuA/transferrin family substrate-binding protein [Alphaproteobacteria bacterium]|nr:PhnD/SsuA/transferrin family substrate-binding protein [Alphaproteobacteria bacterium]
MMRGACIAVAALALIAGAPTAARTQEPVCVARGALDQAYCDADRDLVADPPVDRTRWRNPPILTISMWPEERLELAKSAMEPLVDHLARCAAKRVAQMQIVNAATQIEAMRAGRLHVTLVLPERMPMAVNVAGAVPFAIPATATATLSTRVQLVVRAGPGAEGIGSLRGKTVVHRGRGDLLGDLVVRGLLPRIGITPGSDYTIVNVADDDQALAALNDGRAHAAVVSPRGIARLVATQPAARDRYRRLWESAPIPPAGWVHAHDLVPALRDRVAQCMREYRFPEAMRAVFGEADRVVAATYARDWEAVRIVAETVDLPRTRGAHDAEFKASAAHAGGGSDYVLPLR